MAEATRRSSFRTNGGVQGKSNSNFEDSPLTIVEYEVTQISPICFEKGIDSIKSQNPSSTWKAKDGVDINGENGKLTKLPSKITIKLSLNNSNEGIAIKQLQFVVINVTEIRAEFINQTDGYQNYKADYREVLLDADEIFEKNVAEPRRRMVDMTEICQKANLKIQNPKFHTCIITLKNCYQKELQYECPFEIVSIQFKTTKQEYERVQQAILQAKNKNNAYPTQQRVPPAQQRKATPPKALGNHLSSPLVNQKNYIFENQHKKPLLNNNSPLAPDSGMNDNDKQLQRIMEISKKEYEEQQKAKQFWKEAGIPEDYGESLMNSDIAMEDNQLKQLREEEAFVDKRDKIMESKVSYPQFNDDNNVVNQSYANQATAHFNQSLTFGNGQTKLNLKNLESFDLKNGELNNNFAGGSDNGSKDRNQGSPLLQMEEGFGDINSSSVEFIADNQWDNQQTPKANNHRIDNSVELPLEDNNLLNQQTPQTRGQKKRQRQQSLGFVNGGSSHDGNSISNEIMNNNGSGGSALKFIERAFINDQIKIDLREERATEAKLQSMVQYHRAQILQKMQNKQIITENDLQPLEKAIHELQELKSLKNWQ